MILHFLIIMIFVVQLLLILIHVLNGEHLIVLLYLIIYLIFK